MTGLETAEYDGNTYQFVWRNVDSHLAQEVTHLWTENRVLPVGVTPDERIKELLTIARDDKGTLIGVATAAITIVPEIDAPFFNCRFYVAYEARKEYVMRYLIRHSFDIMEQRRSHEAVGFYVVVENVHLLRARDIGVTAGNRLSYLGLTPAGQHRRIRYFHHAKMPG